MSRKSKSAFQFKDPETGLFWTGNLKPGRGTMFNEAGVEVRDERSANAMWRQYEAMKILNTKPEVHLPDLVRVEYTLSYTTVNTETFVNDDRFMIEALFARASPHSAMLRFARQIVSRNDWQDYPYVVETNQGGEKKRLDDLTESLSNPLVSSRKTSHRLIAVRSETDMLYCKLQLGDQYKCAWEVATARRIS